MRKRLEAKLALVLIFLWAALFVCSDHVLIYAMADGQEDAQLSSLLLEAEETWIESTTDFLIQDTLTWRNRIRNNGQQMRMKMMQIAWTDKMREPRFWKKSYSMVALEIDKFFNEKMIMNYLHRQDGDK